MTQLNLLAFDLGAESGRAVLGKLADDKITLTELHRFSNPTGLMNSRLQWDILNQWEHLKQGIRNAAAAGHTIDGIGVDTWGVDFGLLARDGELLGNPTHYRDLRTRGMLEHAFTIVPRPEIFAATGIQLMEFNSLYQLLALKKQASSLLDSADALLFMPDLFNYLFTARRTNELSIASTSQMLDPRTRQWHRGLLQRMGIPERLLQEIVLPGKVIGPMTPTLADELRVKPAPVIAVGCHDTASAVAAVPAEGPDVCYISSGTWSLMGVELDEPIINDQSAALNYTNELGVDAKVRFLKNIMGLWLVQECRRQFTRDGYEHSYAELTQMAERCKPLGTVIDPEHASFLRPGNMPENIARFAAATGQTVPTARAEFVRVCLDSLAVSYRRTLEGLEKTLGRTLSAIHIVGGGSQNELLNQMTADACNRPVIAGPVEATAIGNLLVQAMALGAVKDLSDLRRIVRNSFDVRAFKPRNPKPWNALYARFQSVLGKGPAT